MTTIIIAFAVMIFFYILGSLAFEVFKNTEKPFDMGMVIVCNTAFILSGVAFFIAVLRSLL